MNFPLISEYIEAIKSAEDNFEQLKDLRPVLGDDGLPVMTSGNFAVVFKMKDEQSGKFYALKCFTKDQEGRAEAYREIVKELKDVSSPYLVSIQYFEKELFVDTDQTTETEYPVLLMDWVEGKTLDKYLRENLADNYTLEMLVYRFSQLAQWLIPQPFAHGDLKPDNILVREDGTLVLVDYDGMYVPTMKGQKARELGSPDFRHPLRTENDFDEHIDDFPLVSMNLSLKAIVVNPSLLNSSNAEHLLFSENDYLSIDTCLVLKNLFPSTDKDLNRLYGLFLLLLSNKSLYLDLNLFMEESPKINRRDDVESVETWVDEYGAIYSKDKTKLIVGADINEYTILEGTKIICDGAFEGFRKLSKINIPSSISSIGAAAFYDCINLLSAKIPSGVSYLDGYTFSGCVSLKKVELPNSLEDLYLNAFSNCISLYSINLPGNLKSIGNAAFADCVNLTEVFFNSFNTYVEKDAFANCPQKLVIYVPQGQLDFYKEMIRRFNIKLYE